MRDGAQPGTRGTVVVLGSYAPSLIVFRGPLIEELVQRGYRVVAMAPRIDDAIRTRLEAIGAGVMDVPLVNSSLNPLSAAQSLIALTQRFRDVAPEAVIAYTVKPVTLGSLAAARAGVPKIVALVTGLGFAFTAGGGAKRFVSRAAASALYRRAFRRCTAIIFQNRDDREDFDRRRLLPPHVPVAVVNGSGIDLDSFRPAPLPPGIRFLMISRLLGDKGVREYGEAAVRLKRRHPQARFALVGYFDPSPDSISEAELARMTAGGVEFLGKMDDVRQPIAESNVYVLPSYREGTPRSVLEAMAMARPIVTTDAPGCRETVVRGENGLLVPPRDAVALEQAMERFILEPETIAPMGARSREIAERKYDIHGVNAAILEAAGL